jgi:hypothetical protein
MHSGDVPHRISLTDADICSMHTAHVHEDDDVPVDVVLTLTVSLSIARFRGASAPLPLLPLLQIQGRRCENVSIR